MTRRQLEHSSATASTFETRSCVFLCSRERVSNSSFILFECFFIYSFSTLLWDPLASPNRFKSDSSLLLNSSASFRFWGKDSCEEDSRIIVDTMVLLEFSTRDLNFVSSVFKFSLDKSSTILPRLSRVFSTERFIGSRLTNID